MSDSDTIDVATSDDEVRRVLVLSHEGLGGEPLKQAIAERTGQHGNLHVRVLVPALASTLDKLAGDVDDNIDGADSDGERIAADLRSDDVQAEAEIGDSDSDQALEDALALFPADEIIVVNPRESEMNRIERAATEHAKNNAPLPVAELNV